MLNRSVCRKLGEAVGCWLLSEAPTRAWAAEADILVAATACPFHQLLVRQLVLQEGEFFWEDSLAYREYARSLSSTVSPVAAGGSATSPPRLRLIVVYPESYGNLDADLEELVGRPVDGGGSNGEDRDLDWSFEAAEAEYAEEVLFRLRSDERFTARLIEVAEE